MWTNYGDVNFLEYGGILLKPAFSNEDLKDFPSLKSVYSIFTLTPLPYEPFQDKVLAALCQVDVDDYREDDGLIDNFCCKTEEEIAVSAVEYYGAENFSPIYFHGAGSQLITRKEAASWLHELGYPN